MNRRNNKKVVKQLKDYIVPIALVGIVMLILLSKMFSGNSNGVEKTPTQETSFLETTIAKPDTEVSIIYSGGKKSKLENAGKIYAGEKVTVGETGDAGLKLPNDGGDLLLNSRGELKYNTDGSYSLISSDLWVISKTKQNFQMKYINVSSSTEAVYNLSQNEAASTVYVVSGAVEVTAPSGNSTMLQKGDKLVVMRNNSTDKNFDLGLNKVLIDDYTKNEDFFIKNNGNMYLNKVESTGSTTVDGSGNVLENSGSTFINSNASYIQFNNIYDEQDLTSDLIDISGTILDDSVYTITINGKDAKINTTDKTFELKDFKINAKINDVVYKIYDSSSKLLYKGLITLYYANSSNTNIQTGDDLAATSNYPIAKSDSYTIVSPKQNPYNTTEDNIRIEGYVPAGTISKITINGYKLTKFIPNSTYWYYFANTTYGNLKEGVNIYNIKYLGADDKVVYENNFVVVKSKFVQQIVVPEEKKIEIKKETNSGSEIETATGITE